MLTKGGIWVRGTWELPLQVFCNFEILKKYGVTEGSTSQAGGFNGKQNLPLSPGENQVSKSQTWGILY